MRIELVLSRSGLTLENIIGPTAWQRTPFAACVVGRIDHARFEEPPTETTIVLHLPASP